LREAIEIALGGILQGSVFALVALGFALVYRVTGAINLAQGAFVVFGALTLYTFQETLHLPLPIAFLSSLVVSLIVGLVLGAFIFRPALRKLPMGGMVLLTGGLLTFFEGVMLLVWGSQPYQLQPWSGFAPVNIGGIHIPTQGFWDFGVTAIIIVGMWYVLQKTTIGKALRACSENPAAAALMGIDVPRMTVLSFAVAAAIGCVSGMVIGPVVSLEFDGGSFFTTSGFISVAIGGFGSFVGALIGGLSLGTIEQLAAGYVSSLFSTTLALGLLLIVLIWKPTGLLGSGSRRRVDVRDASVHAYREAVRLSRKGAIIGGIGALVVLAVLPFFLNTGGILSSIVITGILFFAILGLDILMGYGGQVSLGHAAFLALGAYSAAIMTTRYNQAPIVGIAVGLVVSLVCATVVSFVTVKLRGHYMALATLAFGLLVDSVAVGATGISGGPSGIAGIPHFSIFGYTFDTQVANYYMIWGLVVVGVIVLSNLVRSDFGRALRAIRTDQTAARALGINVPRYKLMAFLISAGFASVAGSLYAYYFQFISPEMVSTQRSFELVTMLVVGGEATLVGPVIGAVILTLLPTVFQPLANFKTLAEGLILVGALLYLPSGIFGGILAALQKKSDRPVQAPPLQIESTPAREGVAP
jgi:branched-chain amino acid transport system permease protein